jgi:hypothetical protein
MWVCGAFVYIGGRSTSAINIGLLYAASPVLIALASALWLGERLRAWQWAGVALALAGGVEVRWFTALGVLCLLATFAIDAAATQRAAEAFPIPCLALLLAGYALRAVGTPWVYADAVLAGLLVAAPFAAAMIPDDRAATRAGMRRASAALCVLLAIPALDFAMTAEAAGAHRAVPLAVALACAFAANGWAGERRFLRVALYAAAGLFVEVAALLVIEVIEVRLDVHDRFATFLLAPLAFAFLGAWLALRRSEDGRVAEAAHVLRVWASVGAGVAAYRALPLLADSALDERGAYLFALAAALLAAAPLPVTPPDTAASRVP